MSNQAAPLLLSSRQTELQEHHTEGLPQVQMPGTQHTWPTPDTRHSAGVPQWRHASSVQGHLCPSCHEDTLFFLKLKLISLHLLLSQSMQPSDKRTPYRKSTPTSVPTLTSQTTANVIEKIQKLKHTKKPYKLGIMALPGLKCRPEEPTLAPFYLTHHRSPLQAPAVWRRAPCS